MEGLRRIDRARDHNIASRSRNVNRLAADRMLARRRSDGTGGDASYEEREHMEDRRNKQRTVARSAGPLPPFDPESPHICCGGVPRPTRHVLQYIGSSNFSRLDASVPIGCTQFMQARQAHQAMDAWLDASVGLDK